MARSPAESVAATPPAIRRKPDHRGAGGANALSAAPAESVLRTSGEAMAPAVREEMESRFGRDFSAVRVHNDAPAHRAAMQMNAEAFTSGSDIVFAAGRYDPDSGSGRRLLAHELTHVVQQSPVDAGASPAQVSVSRRSAGGAGIVQRDAADLALRFNEALSRSDWDGAARALMEMTDADAGAELRLLNPEVRMRIRNAAYRIDPNPDNRVVRLVEAAEATVPPAPRAAPASPAADDVAALSSGEKLLRALRYSFETMGDDARRELENLLSPQSLLIMAGFVAAYIAAQLTPIGWIADGIALASLTVAAFFIGRVVFDVLGDLFHYFEAVNASTESQLRDAGRALSRAVARGGIQVVVLLLMRGLRGGRGAGTPPRAPPPALGGELVTTGGLVVRVPPAAVPEVPISRAPGSSMPFSRGPLGEPPVRPGRPPIAPTEPALPEPVRPSTPGTPPVAEPPPVPRGPSVPESPLPEVPQPPTSPPMSRMPARPARPGRSTPELGDGSLAERMPWPVPVPRRGPDPDTEDEGRRRRCRGMAVGQRGGNNCHDAFATLVSGTSREWGVETPEGDFVEFDGLGVDPTLYEIKTGYTYLLSTSPSTQLLREQTIHRFIDQSQLQLHVAERCGYRLVWVFNNRQVADLVDGFIQPRVTYRPFDCDIDR